MASATKEAKPRERLLQAADDLFYREGIHTVGIDRILEHAGVAKASLYSTFGSKDELVRAYLEGRAQRLQARIEARLATIDDARERALGVFDTFVERVGEGNYLGCPFVRACAERPLEESPANAISAKHRAWRLGLFTRLAKEWGSRAPQLIARQLSVLYDGAAIAVGMDGDASAAVAARAAAESLLGSEDSSVPKRGEKPPRSAKARTI